MLVQVLQEACTKRGLGQQETYWGFAREKVSREARRGEQETYWGIAKRREQGGVRPEQGGEESCQTSGLPSGKGEERESSGE